MLRCVWTASVAKSAHASAERSGRRRDSRARVSALDARRVAPLHSAAGGRCLKRDAARGRGDSASRRYLVLLGAAAVVLVVDQVTKQIALDALRDRPVDVIRGALTLRLTFNSGGAFGVLQSAPGLFLAATVIIVAVILSFTPRVKDPRLLVPMGMILGGGLGNVADRVFRPLGGRVIDFIDLHVWPVFNLADSAIVLGLILIVVLESRAETRRSLPG